MAGFGWKVSVMRWILRQCHDLTAYWAVPLLCFLLPTRAGNAVMRFTCRRNWFYRTHVENALRNADGVVEIGHPREWAYRVRITRFLDAVDVWHGRFSSDRRLARSLLTVEGEWPGTPSVVMVGTHAGPGTLSLRRLASGGFVPRFIYRDMTNAQLKRAPFLHAYQAARIRYMRWVSRDRAIRVPGGRKQVAEAIGEPGHALVLLPDAPAQSRRGDRLDLFGFSLPIDARGLEEAVTRGAPCSFFSMYWDDAKGRRIMHIRPPRVFRGLEEALDAYNDFLVATLSHAPAQWHLWAIHAPVLRDRASQAASAD